METLSALYSPGSSGDTSSQREQLILEHLPQVRWIATRFHERLPQSSLEDLMSIGIIGLINAIDNFDPGYEVKLKTYAEHRIRGAILDSIRGSDGVPIHKRKRLKEIEHAITALEQRLHRAPSEEEIAAALGVNLDTYHEWLLELRGVSIGSLDAVNSPDDSRTLMQFVASDEEESPAHLLEQSELRRVLVDAIQKMPKLEGMVLDLYYRRELGIKEIAQVLNIHITRVSQIKSQGVLRLRAYMAQRWPTKGATR